MVKYVYDAWGNHSVKVLDSTCTELSQLNPFRYRGYYYDVETGLYYLQTRYYDPEVGRFITIDDLSYLDPETINGLNLYAYCGNNPVMAVDPEGTKWWKKLFKWIGTAFAVCIVIVGGIIATVASMGALSPLVGLGLATLGGALLGLAGGITSSIVVQVKANGWNNVDFGKVWLAGGIGLIGGAFTGALSFSAAKILEGIGSLIGFALSKITICGFEVSKVISSKIMMTVFSKLSAIIGGAATAYAGDYLGSRLFNQSYTQDSAKETTQNILLDWLLELGRWLFKL